MSEFKYECGGRNPEPFLYMRDNGSREDVRSPEENPANSPEESIEQEGEEWKEADLQVNEEENDGDLQVNEESEDEDEDGQNRRKNRSRPGDEEGRPGPITKRRRIIRMQPKNSFGLKWDRKRERPDDLAGREIGLWYRDHRRTAMTQEFMEVIVSLRTQYFMRKFLDMAIDETSNAKTSDVKTPDAETSDVETSDVKTPDAETSDVETSDVKKPDAETSDVETSDVKTPDAETSDVETYNAKTSDVKTPDVETSNAKTSDVKTPDVETSNAASNKNGCNFLTRAWEFEEEEEVFNETCIQENVNDADLDAKYYEEELRKKQNLEYNEMCALREKLPAHKMKDKIVQLINENQVCFISGGTGCGKTTQIVQFVLDDWIMNMNGSVCNIVCTQPRRISASSVAQRIADERLEPLSLSVGYQIRFENKLSERKVGCINFVTTGVLLQWLVTNPYLPHISHIFLDEIHEKTIEFDTVMVLLKNVIEKRPNVRVILMSATIDSVSFCKYFGGAPDLEIPGYTFPVEEFYLDDILKMTDYKVPEKKLVGNYDTEFGDSDDDFPCLRNLVHRSPFLIPENLDMPLIAHLIGYICQAEGEGAMLVFLPGLSDIMKLKKRIEGSPWYSSEKHLLVAAHSMLPAEAQTDIFTIPPEGKRKIILATSIMETSVTLNDMSYVVDCGKIKCYGFDINLKVPTLNTTWISTANAKQRRGRVGRTKPGKCYKLYTKDQENDFLPYPRSDVQMTSLEHIILEAKLMKIKQVGPFLEKMMDPPHPVLVELALKELKYMNALDSEERLTALGYHLSKLPMDVRTGKMILMGAFFSCIDPIFSIAACLNFKDPFNIVLDEDKILEVKNIYGYTEISDHMILCGILKDWENQSPSDRPQFCAKRSLSHSNLTQISDAKKQFAKILYSMNFLPSPDVKDPASNVNSRNKELIKAVLCAGLYPSVATSKRTRNKGVITLDGHFAVFHGKSHLSEVQVFAFPFFVYFYKLRTSSKIFLHDASMIEVLPLLLFSKSFEIVTKDYHCFVHIDDKLKFKMGRRASDFLKEVRTRLDQIIGQALLKSEGFNWSQRGKEIEFLSGIVDFITNNNMITKIRNSI